MILFVFLIYAIYICSLNLNYSLNTHDMKTTETTKFKTQQPFNLSVADAERFNQIYAKHFNVILNYLKYKVSCVEDAEDICIETFVKACRYMDSYDENQSKVSTWLHNIANSCIVSYYRSSVYTDKETCVSDIVDSEGRQTFVFKSDVEISDTVESKEFQHKVAKAFRSLKPKYRKIATLYFLREKEYKEIAEICQVPMGTVKGMISRCRAMLQMELA